MKLLLLDIDGTLIHKHANPDSIQIPGENTWLHKTSKELLRTIMEHVPVVLVSGRRSTSYERVCRIVPHTRAILEHGGLVEPRDTLAKQWHAKLASVCDRDGGVLWQFAQDLKEQGFIIDDVDRVSSFWVGSKTGNFLSEDERQKITQQLPDELQLVGNAGMVGVMPTVSGKLSAVNFFSETNGITMQDVAFIGDDENDVSLLEQVGWAATFKNAHPAAREAVEKRGARGYIGPAGHEGIITILNDIRTRLRRRST